MLPIWVWVWTGILAAFFAVFFVLEWWLREQASPTHAARLWLAVSVVLLTMMVWLIVTTVTEVDFRREGFSYVYQMVLGILLAVWSLYQIYVKAKLINSGRV